METSRNVESECWIKAKEIRKSCEEYAWPPRGPDAEKTSFAIQCNKFLENCTVPTSQEIKETIDLVNKEYIRFKNPDYLKSYDREIWSNVIDDFKQYIKEDASPGVPFKLIANTNGQVLEKMGSDFNDMVLDRIESRLYFFDHLQKMSRKELLENNIYDPVRVFVKNEPHLQTKIDEGRVRLIMSVSLADKMIEMLLSRHLHKLEIANWRDIPSKPGIGFTREDNKFVFDNFMSEPDMAYTDISGWDWSCKSWLMEAEAEGRIALCDNPSEVWCKLVRAEPIIESSSIYQFSDGTLVCPIFRGIVNSGKFKTSRGNSWMRVFLAFLIAISVSIKPKCNAAGDDTFERFIQNAIALYLKYGWRLKECVRAVDGFEFCSRWYQKDASFPLNADKMIMNILHSNPKTVYEYHMFMLQFVDQLEDHPEFVEVLNLLKQVGFPSELVGAQI